MDRLTRRLTSKMRHSIREFARQGIETIAICLLNSYLNPQHERELAKLIRSELGPKLVVCLSSDIYPQIREYERATPTAINASLIPVVDPYLHNLETHISTYISRLL